MCTYICTATGGGHRELQRLRQTGSVSLRQQAALAPLSHHSDLDNLVYIVTITIADIQLQILKPVMM